MVVPGISAIAAAESAFERAGAQMAVDADGDSGGSGDVASDAVNLASAANGVAAGAALVRTADQMQGTLLDLLA